MSEMKVNFNFQNQKIELKFPKDTSIQNILSSFTTKINRNINDFNFLYSGEKLNNYETKSLAELNDKDNIINISAYEKKEINEKSNSKIKPENISLKVSDHIICPRCKYMSEIVINNFKIYITNCNNNHSMPGLFMNDFITTQYLDESRIICFECKKTQKELHNSQESEHNKLLMCSCGISICQSCFQTHKEKSLEKNSNKQHNAIPYQDKDYYCFEHNAIYTSYCQKCKKNICEKCEEKHNNHVIDNYQNIVPKETYLQNIKKMNNELITKVKKFNDELNELMNLLNNISNNIQKDLNTFLDISNKVINDFNLEKKNYQVIQNLKVINNTINDSPILKNIDLFLSDSNSNSRIKCLLDMYNTMYLESSNIIDDVPFILNKINENNLEENKIHEKKDYKNYMTLKYIPNIQKIKGNKIKLFGTKFCENNKDNCSITINEKEYSLSEYYIIKKNDIKNNELEVKLNQIKPLNNMSYMFQSNENEPINLSEISSIIDWDTSNVTDISNLFYNCSLLKSVQGLSNFNTSNITNISNLFYNCINLTSIDDISKWNVDKVTNMSNLFFNCKNIISLPDISTWNTKNVKDMRGLFCNCSSLKSLPDISKLNTENAINMSSLFRNCSSLEKLPNISLWNMGNVVYIGGMFSNCSSLKNLPDIDKWDTKNISNLNFLFYRCNNLTSMPDISVWNTKNAKNMRGLFCDCSSLSILPDISKWDTNNVTNMSLIFCNCNNLLSLPDLAEWNTNKVDDIKSMFTNCNKLPEQIIPKKFKN